MKSCRLNRVKIIIISLLLALILVLGIVAGVMLYREKQLNTLQQEALQELADNEGEYDEQKIVLYDTSESEAKMLAEKFNAALRITSDGKFATLTLADGTTVEDVYSVRANRKYLSELSLDYNAKTSETESRVTSSANYTVTDTYYSLQSYLDYLNIGDAWTTTKGSGITVAIIDTGIDTDHSEFAGIISEYSYNATEDKIVKDYTSLNGGYDWSLIEDEQGHGTSVAGVIAAAMDGNGTVGISPQVNLLIIKAECDVNGNFLNTSDLVFGLYYAIEQDADVVNMSFGAYSSVNPFASATKLAVDSDIICVAAAGNDGTTTLCYPAADENVIGVGALAENSWELAAYSNYGENSDVVAPGTTYTTAMGGGYKTATGTSLASPIVAGAIALYLTQNKYSEFSDVAENLYASSYDLGSLGDDWEYGYGALDINAFVCEERGTVTFDMLTDELEDVEQIFVVGHTLQNLPEPERTYAVFDGWYYDIECTEELNWYEDVFTSDLTLYAKWVNEDDGVPYTYVTLGDGTIEIRSYTGKRRYITIPETIDGKVVSSIGDEAFSGETRLRQVNLPSGLTNIGRNAFYNCSNLLEIEIPEGVTKIGENAFYNCTRLSSVALTGDSKLTTVGDYAFAYSGLTRFELPSNLSSINGSAFYGATSLKAITVVSGNANFSADGGVLFNYTKSTLIAYPAGLSGNSYTVPEAVRTIGSVAFAYAKIKGIDLTNVTTIGGSAFIGSSLESLVIPDCVTSLGNSAFRYNFYLKTVTLGSGLTSISEMCFYACSMLTSIVIPVGIQTINVSAFADDTNLSSVTFASGGTLISIGGSAFTNCISLTEIVIPSSVVLIGSFAFAKDYNLSSVTFESGSSLQTIGNSAFYYNSHLTEIELPENLQTIGTYAFQDSGLKTITLPSSLTSLGTGAFASCHSLTAINVESGNTVYVSLNGVVYDIAKTTIVEYPAGNAADTYTIESTVTTVGAAAFYGSWKLTTVELPSALVTVSDYAFYDCENITGYTLPDGLVEIGDYSLAYNVSLKSLAMPDSLYQIGKYSVYGDYALKSITFNETSTLPRISYGSFAYCGITTFRVPASVSTIAQGAFQGCDYLISITFAENSKLSYISAYMFDGCSNLKYITFESGSALTNIEAHGFEGMTNLVSVDFGDAQLTNIDNYAFRYCESLTTLDIPDGVTYIGRYAFYGCKSLVSLTLPESIDYIGRYAFYAYGSNSVNIYFKAETLPENLQENWDYGIGGYYVGVTDVTTSGDWSYAVTSSGSISIIKYSGSETAIDLTKVNLGGNITSIGGYAFYNTSVSSVVLPHTLTSIQNYAFARSQIAEITIPDSVTFIGKYAFFYTPLQSVTFGENSGLKKIEQYAFYYTKSLTSITLPASLTSLGSYAFYYSGITQVKFADGIKLTEISAYAFADSGLTSVTLPDSVTYINDNAFRNCTNLTTLTFGAGTDIEIHSNAFYNTGLTTLYIPANVRYIGEYAFVGLTSLTAFEVSKDNKNYSSYDGLLYNKDQSKLIAVPAAKSGTIYLPESLETIGFGAFENTAAEAVVFNDNSNILAIGYRAFYNAQNLTSVYIPASVVTIDFYAFAMCSNLTTVTFAEGSRLTGVYEGAFYGCISLTDILLPDSIIEISDYAFYGCSALTEIPISANSRLMGIYDYAFAYSGLTELILPETIIDIGDYAFRGCKLTAVYIPDTSASQLIIGIGAFADCEELAEITLPFIGASYEDDEITWFGYIFGAGGYAANSTYVPASLKTVTISEGITFIGTGAFYECTNLEYINVPDSVTMLYIQAFCGTTAIYELTNTITVQGNIAGTDMFGYGISGNLNLAEGVTYISFRYCTYLESINIPSSVTNIGQNTFEECSLLFSVEIPSGVTSIGSFAFENCASLSSVTIPEGVTSIGECAFVNCRNLLAITIPSTVTSIGSSAFSSSGITYITNLSNLVFEIGSEDYGRIAQNAKVIIDKDGNKTYLDETSGYTFIDTEDGFRFVYENGKYTLQAYFGGENTVTLPTEINGQSYTIYHLSGVKNVIIPDCFTQIDEGAFYECTTLKSIVIPDSVTYIGSSAFQGCQSLYSIDIPDSVTYIGNRAFAATTVTGYDGDAAYSNSGLTTITLPKSLTYLGGAFWGCTNLTEIIIPNGITFIESSTFAYCVNLVNVVIPDSVTDIGGSAFYYCRSLKNIILTDSVATIGNNVFYACTDLTSITIPKSVNYIGSNAFSNSGIKVTVDDGNSYFYSEGGVLYNAEKTQIVYISDSVTEIVVPNTITDISSIFYGCSNLVSVTFEEGCKLTSIGSYAFYNCSSLTNIEIPNSVTNIEDLAFYGCSSLTDIEIPNGVISIGYYAFEYCSNLTEIEIPDSVNYIGVGAFGRCITLRKVVLPNNISSILQDVFYGCYSLVDIEIPESVTSIDRYAFDGCGLTSIVIPSGVTSIGEGAFQHCTRLNQITNYSDLELTLGSEDNGCVAYYAKLIIDKNGNKTYLDETSGFTYIDTTESFRFIYENGSYTLIAYLGTEKTVTLPTDINGCEYTIYNFSGAQNVVIPEGITSIGDYAFSRWNPVLITPSGTVLKSITFADSITSIGNSAFAQCEGLTNVIFGENSQLSSIGEYAFYGCTALTNIVLPDTVISIAEYAFDYSLLYTDTSNYKDGCLYSGNCLIRVDTSAKYVIVKDETVCIAEGAFDACYSLIYLAIGGNHSLLLSDLTNIETLVITEMPTSHYIYQYFGYYGDFPITLQQIVIKDTTEVKSADVFCYITDVTIYVEASSVDAMWDDDYVGWSNGNYVYYGENWISAEFRGADGSILNCGYYLTSQVVRQPYIAETYDEQYTYSFEGWDIDGDGKIDAIPATSTYDIVATAVIKKTLNEYVVCFYDKDGSTILYSYSLAYGSVIELPEDPIKTGYVFAGWNGYSDGMTVTGNTYIYSTWEHTGGGHVYGELLTQEASCEESGYTYYQCTICGELKKVDIISATGHSYSTELLKDASTCTEDGYTYYKCSICGGVEIVEIIPATGHNYGDWITEVEAECTTDGSRYHVCAVCGFVDYEVVGATGHSYIGTVTKEATCTIEGEITYVCEYCGDMVTEVLETTEHNYVKKYVSKTLLQWILERLMNIFFGYEGGQGYYYECTDCRHIRTADESITLGNASVEGVDCDHANLGEYELILAASCEEIGIYGQYCEDCGELVNIYTIDSLGGHVYGEVITVEVTCTEDGYTYQSCTVCGEIYIISTTTATGHDYVATVTASTCTEQGYTTYVCGNCGDTYIDNYTEVLGHNWNSGEIITQATCTTDGVIGYTCTQCGESYTETIVATGHIQGGTVIENEVSSTCTLNGSYDRVVYCSVCGEELSRENITVAATGHTASDWIVDKEAEVGVAGHRYKVCTICGEVLEEEEIPALTETSDVDDSGNADNSDGDDSSDSGSESGSQASGCAGVIGSDGGSGNMLMLAISMISLCAVYVVVRLYRKNNLKF